ncbi:GNAT family N-acetyltransferase [Algimonas porphyrae]|uniref:N-acetyltransferase n=1 Tax=Algimonas porphyrae TaxID=1128113 RepID=A0ABQ5UVH4_9PROT|nr:GNAT family N-acetyltransferase [Algimonas porphyrae]GLQ19263.1 N-acetyltransferase [Algimonas porphyrae]
MRDIVHTERLTLRTPELRDGPALAKHFSDFDVVKMTGTIPFPYLSPAADFWIFRTRARQRRGLAQSYMMETRSGDVIGNISLFRSSPEDDYEVGYHIGRDWWGLGYATEACHTVLSEAKSTGHTHIVAGVYDDNPASQRLLAKFGFTQTGTDNIWCMARGERVSGRRYALDLSQFTPMSARHVSTFQVG